MSSDEKSQTAGDRYKELLEGATPWAPVRDRLMKLHEHYPSEWPGERLLRRFGYMSAQLRQLCDYARQLAESQVDDAGDVVPAHFILGAYGLADTMARYPHRESRHIHVLDGMQYRDLDLGLLHLLDNSFPTIVKVACPADFAEKVVKVWHDINIDARRLRVAEFKRALQQEREYTGRHMSGTSQAGVFNG